MQLKKSIETEVEAIINNYNPDNETAQALAIDDLQSHYECCGSIKPQDWDNNTWMAKEGKYPASCCAKTDAEGKFCPKEKAFKVIFLNKVVFSN